VAAVQRPWMDAAPLFTMLCAYVLCDFTVSSWLLNQSLSPHGMYIMGLHWRSLHPIFIQITLCQVTILGMTHHVV
jgi:hypothetical protein